MKLTQISALVAAAMLSLGANAEPFYMVVPNGVGNTTGTTATSYQMQANWEATSIYTDNDSSYDGTNDYTFVTTGDTVQDIGTGNITNLLKLNGSSWTGSGNTQLLGINWQLSFDYSIFGQVIAVDNSGLPSSQGIGAYYGDGVVDGDNLINVYYDVLDGNGDPLSHVLVMNLEVLSSSGTIGNAVFNAAVDFTGVDAIAQDMFLFADGTNWFDLWTAGQPLPGIEIAARVDTNIDPQTVPVVDGDVATRTNTLNGSVEFNRVPEPGSLALLGLGLLGLGLGRRHFKQA